ncbi:MAG TPA: inositol monophosphatase family protein [Allosphingosinicella sp.]|nr:inositol monophosphatase family protein [Allosphingosinicella sp.]
MSCDLESLARFAVTLACAAREVTMSDCDGGVSVENKLSSGYDPVTLSDRNAELAIRRLIEGQFPDHGISGEEGTDKKAAGPLTWSIDPIDGTRAYICGLPSWTTLIALLKDGEPVLGLIDAPRLDEMYLGFGGHALKRVGTTERPITTSGCTTLADARASTTDPYLFEGTEADGFERLRRAVRLTRYGLDGYGYAALAAGGIDIVAESGLKPHDYHALVPIIRAAGGAVANWSGGSDLGSGQIVAAATEPLLDAACRVLSGR